jgi:capsular polysaccharide biosynthesis protein
MMNFRLAHSPSTAFEFAPRERPLKQSSPSRRNEKADNFGRAMGLVKRRLPLVLASVVLGAAVAVYAAFALLPSYTAKALIGVNETELSDPTRAADAAVDTHLTMLQSPAFLARVYELASRDARTEKEVARPADLERRLHVMQEMRSRLIGVSFTAHSPDVAASVVNLVVRTYLDGLSVQSAQAIDEAVASLERRIAALEADLQHAAKDAARGESTALASDSTADLEKQINEARVNLALARRLQESRHEAFAMSPPARVVALAEVPQRPSSVRPIVILVPALAASAIFGVALALLLGRLDPRIYDESDLAEHFETPCVGATPRRRRAGALSTVAMGGAERVGYARAMDAVATAVLLLPRLLPRARPRTVLIASSVEDPGKSVFAVSFGSAAAKLGLRTLLIELDGAPQGGRWLRWRAQEPRLGVVDVLSDRCAPSEAIERLPGTQIDRLPASTDAAEDALAHIARGRLEAVVKQLSPLYDCIILVAPPVVGSSTARLAAAHADAALLIARSGHSTYAEVAQGLDLLASSMDLSSAGALALVLTDAPARSLPSSYRDETPIRPTVKSSEVLRLDATPPPVRGLVCDRANAE